MTLDPNEEDRDRVGEDEREMIREDSLIQINPLRDHLYVALIEELWIKVGRSIDPSRRLKRLRSHDMPPGTEIPVSIWSRLLAMESPSALIYVVWWRGDLEKGILKWLHGTPNQSMPVSKEWFHNTQPNRVVLDMMMDEFHWRGAGVWKNPGIDSPLGSRVVSGEWENGS